MRIWKKPWFIPIILTVVIIVGGQLYTAGKLTKANTLSENEIQKQLTLIYQGEIEDLQLQGSVYTANVIKGSAEYAVEVDAGTGKVLSLIQTKESVNTDVTKAEQDDKEKDAVTGGMSEKTEDPLPEKEQVTEKPPVTSDKNKSDTNDTTSSKTNTGKTTTESKPSNKPTTPPKKPVLISEQQAANIGMTQLPAGMVGEVDDVDYKETENGGYYLVQIDIDTDDDLDEVTYQIHAITGAVMTVSWDE
ncbi:PepSY domain-containing protein [Sporosarcina sp. OR05]|uniref:PepSY domain-containing protein n=1 Tax=Sporosarcina sp. OR05 TaxID=2969819 RepID=UPI00352BCC52